MTYPVLGRATLRPWSGYAQRLAVPRHDTIGLHDACSRAREPVETAACRRSADRPPDRWSRGFRAEAEVSMEVGGLHELILRRDPERTVEQQGQGSASTCGRPRTCRTFVSRRRRRIPDRKRVEVVTSASMRSPCPDRWARVQPVQLEVEVCVDPSCSAHPSGSCSSGRRLRSLDVRAWGTGRAASWRWRGPAPDDVSGTGYGRGSGREVATSDRRSAAAIRPG